MAYPITDAGSHSTRYAAPTDRQPDAQPQPGPNPQEKPTAQPQDQPRAAAENSRAGVAAAAKPEMPFSGFVGFDISWPQCPNDRPAGDPHFAIIGVTGGKAFTENRCFRQQFEWANAGQVAAQVYTNVNGMPEGYHNNACAANDGVCNLYRYGWDTAIHALDFARSQQANPQWWWLDVETMNYWRPDQGSNAWVIRGAIEALQSNGRTVGLYSTPYQWNQIAGGFNPGLPVWTAGAESHQQAIGRCNPRYAFGGGEVKLVQFIWAGFDTNYIC